MTKRIVAVVAVLTVLCCGTDPIASARAKPKPVLQGVVKRLVRDGAPGAVAEVRTSTRIRRAAAGVSQRQPRVPMRPADRFRVASITKSFVATVVLELVAEQKLGLDDTVERWLPGLVPNGGAITLRELLNHTSGLFNYEEDPAWDQMTVADTNRIWLPSEIATFAVAHTPYFAPGAGWHYSNTNFILLGLVIEAATGRSVSDELRDRLFQPLALASTSFATAPALDGGGLVRGYVGSATLPDVTGLWDVTPALNPSWLWTAGAVVSNADDVTTFYLRLLSGRVIGPDLVELMRTVTSPAADYGLGLARFDTRCGEAFGHVGDFTAYRTIAMARANGRRAAVVLVNVDTTSVSWGELELAAEDAFCRG